MTTTAEAFDAGVDRYRPELLAHCYRMLGSVHDAEDLVQETMVRAWRSYDRFDPRRASLRTWLYRIATNACLTALESRRRRPLPSGLGGPSDDPAQALVLDQQLAWLQPLPDVLLGPDHADPATLALCRRGVRLAFVAAMQLLPARQRAALILHDVLEWPSADVAGMLDSTTAAVNSAVQRARSRLAATGTTADEIVEPTDPELRGVVDRYVAAFERADVAELRRLLTEDAVLEMPPYPLWFSGRDDYARFIERAFVLRGTDWTMTMTAANGQPAVGAYVRGEDTGYAAHSIQVFTVTHGGIARTTVYPDPDLFADFRLPSRLDRRQRGVDQSSSASLRTSP